MRLSDRYHKWIEWSEEHAAYLGKCRDLITGGAPPQGRGSGVKTSCSSRITSAIATFISLPWILAPNLKRLCRQAARRRGWPPDNGYALPFPTY